MTGKEIYNYIIEQDLYRFNAIDPENIVKIEIRRHCEGIEFPTAKKNKFFQILRDGRYWIKGIQIPGITKIEQKALDTSKKEINELKSTFSQLLETHRRHKGLIRQQLLTNLKALSPTDFEIFSKKLLEIYGFSDLHVTPASKDGGIDGHGKLKVGISHLDVAFQSKRWNNSLVSQKEIQFFRGSIQGKCEQGIYFTTSKYTRGAKEVSLQRGAVPIVLIDGDLIIDFMIDKEFGVSINSMKLLSINFENIFDE